MAPAESAGITNTAATVPRIGIDFSKLAAPIPLVAGIIAEVLHVERVGANDNFFEIGGDSLRGAQVTARVNAATGSSLGPGALFRLPIVAHYAAALAPDAPSRPGPPPLAPRQAPSRGTEE